MPRKPESLALLSFCLLAGLFSPRVHGEEPPVRLVYLDSREGKPPLTFHSVRLTLTNKHDHPVWFVLPYWGEKALPKNGTFTNKGGEAQPFGGKGYKGKGGAAVEVEMYGGDGFKAFRVCAKGSVEVDGYEIEGWKPITEVAVMEARQLKVNGKTPLEKWLPYATLSAKKVNVDKGALNNWKNLDWDPEKFKSRNDYPKEKVTEVKAEKTRLWTLKLERKPAKE